MADRRHGQPRRPARTAAPTRAGHVNTGMSGAGRLQPLIESRTGATRIADLMVQMGRIIDAIHFSVPEELWPEILRKIDGPVAADTPADGFKVLRRRRGRVRPRGTRAGKAG